MTIEFGDSNTNKYYRVNISDNTTIADVAQMINAQLQKNGSLETVQSMFILSRGIDCINFHFNDPKLDLNKSFVEFVQENLGCNPDCCSRLRFSTIPTSLEKIEAARKQADRIRMGHDVVDKELESKSLTGKEFIKLFNGGYTLAGLIPDVTGGFAANNTNQQPVQNQNQDDNNQNNSQNKFGSHNLTG